MRRSESRKLSKIISKINATKKPSAKDERAATAKVKSYDVSGDTAPKPRKVEPIVPPSNKYAKLVHRNQARKRAKAIQFAQEREAHASKPLRRTAIPTPLPMLMAPPLPPMKDGKPNVVALVYAFRAFQQYFHAFNRRGLGDPATREAYYQDMKAQFRAAMEDAGLAEFYDWSDLPREDRNSH